VFGLFISADLRREFNDDGKNDISDGVFLEFFGLNFFTLQQRTGKISMFQWVKKTGWIKKG